MSAASIAFRYFPGDLRSQEAFRSGFERRPFLLTHQIHKSDLFHWPMLLKLAARAEAKGCGYYFESGSTAPGEKWRGIPEGASLARTLENIGESNSLIMLKRVQEYDEFKPLLEACTDELSLLCEVDFRHSYYDPVMTILITSPLRVTPYHIDGDTNFLLQIQGAKTVHIFDRNDAEVLSDVELEKFWSGEDTSAPRYRENLEDRAWRFELVPGTGVSNPLTFPHWVQNGPFKSISLSLNFKRVSDPIADAYRINNALRKLGLHPRRPGTAPLLDGMKSGCYRAMRSLKHLAVH